LAAKCDAAGSKQIREGYGYAAAWLFRVIEADLVSAQNLQL
jgi:hypothetical protein